LSLGALALGALALVALALVALALGALSIGALSLGVLLLGVLSLGALSFGALSLRVLSLGVLLAGATLLSAEGEAVVPTAGSSRNELKIQPSCGSVLPGEAAIRMRVQLPRFSNVATFCPFCSAETISAVDEGPERTFPV
jgi:hypothetical protein